MTHRFKSVLMTSLCCMLLSCSKNNDIGNEPFTPQTYNVNGRVEKGPFVSGSTITVQPMDAKMQVLGTMYSSTIQDNTGNFSFGSKLFEAPYAELVANGYFFNEVSGTLSSGTLNLRAIVDLSDKSTVNINILTHLKYQRILNLITKGESFKSANKQAQNEIFTAFGLQKYAEKDASLFSIAGGNNESASLIAISSLLLVDRSEALITEYIAKLCNEFGQNGLFSNETKSQIFNDKLKLANRLSDINKNIVNRYKDLGINVEVKDLAAFFDWDNDGVAGNETLEEGEQIQIEQTKIDVPNQGGDYTIKITSRIPIYLKPISDGNTPPDIITSDNLFNGLYEDVVNQDVSIDKTINNNVLSIKISPLNSKKGKTTIIDLYDCVGNVVGNISILQAGNINASIPKLGNNGEAIVSSMASQLSSAISIYGIFQQHYQYNKQIDGVAQYVTPSSLNISNMWSRYYTAIRTNLTIKKADSERLDVYKDILEVFSAMQYYYMVAAWGDVPYISDYSEYDAIINGIARTDKAKILSTLVENLNSVLDVLENKKNESLKDINSFFFISSDVARVLLADIYMYQGDYTNACSLLETVINNGFYTLDKTNFSNLTDIENILGGNIDLTKNSGSTCAELIFALKQQTSSTRSSITIASPSVIPVQTYTEVILSYAECLYKLGDTSKAKTYLNKIATVKDITLPDDVGYAISEARRKLLLYSVGNFAYFKRNGTAASEYGVDAYRLLMPIPQQELYTNSKMTQNAEY